MLKHGIKGLMDQQKPAPIAGLRGHLTRPCGLLVSMIYSMLSAHFLNDFADERRLNLILLL